MITTQVAASYPAIYVKNANPLSRRKPSSSLQCVRQNTAIALKVYPRKLTQCVPVLKSRKPHVCLAGGKGMMDNNESRRKSLDEAMKSFREKTQGGNGSKPPRGRGSGGGGGGGGGGSSGGSNETLEIVLATIGFIFVYIYVINGVELTKLARDFISYLLGGTQSVRLKRASYKWAQFYSRITEQKEDHENGLKKSPMQNIADLYRDVLRNYMKPFQMRTN